MAPEGSAAFGAEWRIMEAKVVERPPIPEAMPEYKSAYDIHPHAGERGFDDSSWPVVAPAELGAKRGGGKVSFLWFRAKLTIPTKIGGFETAGAEAVFAVNVDDYAEVWVNGELPRAPGKPSPATIQGFNMRHLRDCGFRHQRADIGGAAQYRLVPRGKNRIFPLTG